MNNLLAVQSRATSIASVPPIPLNPSSAEPPTKGPAPRSYLSGRKAYRRAASRLTAVRVGIADRSVTNTSGRRNS